MVTTTILLTLVNLLISLRTVDGILCISEETKWTAFYNESLLEKIQETIENFPSQEYQEELCRAEIKVYPEDKALFFSFTEHLSSILVENEARLDIAVYHRGGEEMVLTVYLEYACDESNCDKRFFKTALNWMLNSNYSDIVEQVRPIIETNSTRAGNE